MTENTPPLDAVRPDQEAYLSDGVYVSFDGFQIVLRANRAGADHYVYLEPEVWRALQRWLHLFPEVIARMECPLPWTLSPRDSKAFIANVLDPPEPNEALKMAARRYKDLIA